MMLLILLLAGLTVSSAQPGCIVRDIVGHYEGGQVYRYTLDNGHVQVQVMEYGATVTTVRVPDREGRVDDVVLGYDTLEGYLSSDNPYFGSTVGRVANRVGGAQFTLDGVTYQLSRNDGQNSLHGGLRGFDKKLWTSKMEDGRVVMECTSEDGEEGYPGQVSVTVAYSLTEDNTLVIEYTAKSTKRTPINLTNHAYFNLAGQGAGAGALYNHTVCIMAGHITETDSNLIPTGKLMPVEGTEFDLRQPTVLGAAIKKTFIDGFDDNFVLAEHPAESTVAVVEDPGSGRRLEVQTTQLGMQFYTSNSIASIHGKGEYSRHAAFCLEAQNFPDAVNHEEFPQVMYGPGDVYHQVTKYKFGIARHASPGDML